MPSFDVVSRLEMQEIDNAVSNAMKEITQRYDFKGSISKLESSDNKAEIKKAPEIGQDNNDIMREIGYSDEEIKKFYEDEVI